MKKVFFAALCALGVTSALAEPLDHWKYDGRTSMTDGEWTFTVQMRYDMIDGSIYPIWVDGCTGYPETPTTLDFSKDVVYEADRSLKFAITKIEPGFNGSTAGQSVKILKLPTHGYPFNIGDRYTVIEGFKNCHNLESVVPFLPDSCIAIGAGTFNGCEKLASPLVWRGGSGMLTPSDPAWNNSYAALWDIFNGTAIPSVDFSESSMVAVGRAFWGCSALKSVKLPPNMIDFNAPFKNCTSLELVEFNSIPNTLSGFENCSALKEVRFNHAAPSGSIPAGIYNVLDQEIMTYLVLDDSETDKLDAWKSVSADGEINDSSTWSSTYAGGVALAKRPLRLADPGETPDDPTEDEHTHVWGEWTTNTAPTCTTTGLRTHTCTAEGCTTPAAKEEEVIAALGHIEVIDPVVPATTNSTGLTEGKHCSRCGAVLVEQQVIPMLDPEKPYNPPVNPPAEEGDEWFKVIFTNEGHTDIGGAWQGPKEGTAPQSVTNGVNAYVLKNVLNLDFVANTGSPDNADIVVEGKAIVSLSSNFPMVASDTVAGLCFKSGPKVYGYGAKGWQELSGVTPTVGAWVNYQALVSPTNGMVTYYINGTMLSQSLPLKSGTECITYVRYGGSGAVSDVRGYVALASSGPGTVELETPTLRADGGFVCADGAMTLTLDSPVVGAYYTLFTTESFDQPFVAQPGSVQCTSADQVIQFVLDTTDAPAKFAMVVTSLQEIAEGTPLK